ncbi:uncharacterized protein LOC102462432 [Pelodiscus sinensis]|uniref:uncharacterized protein LOC102462432 n=1 Tax=Pelodiscus sinensis TaxID=13735 RepID=UPI003F6BCF16
MDIFSDNAVVRATRTPPPEPPKNQESALRPLTTQNSTRVQMKHPGGPNLTYVKPKDKTKDSGKKQPCNHNSSSSAVTATPCPEETVSENAHIHKPGACALGVLNVRKTTHIHKPGARALGVLNVCKTTHIHKPGARALGVAYKKPRTENSCNAEVLQPHKHNSSSSAATATPSPEKTVSKNAHIHKPGACALGVLNVCKTTHIHKPGARALGVVNKKPGTENSSNAEVLQPRKHNSSSSVATATPSPENTVSENAHIHKPGACALGVLNVRKTTHIHKPGARALGVVNKKPGTENSSNAEVLQPRKHNSSSSVATATPSPENTVSENAHIHKPGACALGVLNVCKTPTFTNPEHAL